MRISRILFLISLLFLAFYFSFINHADKGEEHNFYTKKSDQEIFNEEVKRLLYKNTDTLELKNNNSIFPQASASLFSNSARAVILLDLDSGKVLYEKNSKESLQIASLTKIMTSVVALDLASPDSYFEVTDYAANQIPTKIGVVPQEKMSLKELLNALLLTSANDAAAVIQNGVDKKYKSAVFIKAMNEKAKALNLTSSSFSNPQGFDDRRNYSSLQDLAVLTQYALKNYKEFEEIVGKDYEFLPKDSNHKQFDLYNWNGLVGVYPDTIGVKIGNTGKAGKTTIVVSKRGGKRLLAAVLGAPDILKRDLWAAELLDYGYQLTRQLPPVNVNEQMLQEKYDTWNYF